MADRLEHSIADRDAFPQPGHLSVSGRISYRGPDLEKMIAAATVADNERMLNNLNSIREWIDSECRSGVGGRAGLEGDREVVGNAAYAGRDQPAVWPDQVDVQGLVRKIIEYGDDVGMA